MRLYFFPAADEILFGKCVEQFPGGCFGTGDLDVAFERILPVRAKIGEIDDVGRKLARILPYLSSKAGVCGPSCCPS